MAGGLQHDSLSESDPGEYGRLVSAAWETRHEQLSAGDYGATLEFMASPEAVFYHEKIRGAGRVTGALQDGLFGFGVMCRKSREQGRWWGASHPEHGLVYVEPGAEVDVSLPGGTEKLVAILPVDVFRAKFEAVSGAEPDFLGTNGKFLKSSRSAMRDLSAALRRVMTSPLAGGVEKDGELLSDFLVVKLAECVSRSEPVVPTQSQRCSLVRRTLDMFDRDPAGFRLESACVRLRCSRRTLEYAFREHLRMTPGAYLKVRRLHLCKEWLTDADPQEMTVAKVVRGIGIKQLGRFAGEYERMFGEYPSQTLARPATRRVPAFGFAY